MPITDPLDLLSELLGKARAQGASAADAVLFETTDISTSWRLGKPEGLERSENQAVGLRVFFGQRQAIASAADLGQASLGELAERACAMARLAPPDPHGLLAPLNLRCSHAPDLDLLDGNEPSPQWLQEQCRIAEDTARGIPGISNSEGADANYSRSRISLAIDNGESNLFAKHYAASMFSVSVSVLAGNGEGMERDYDYSSARHKSDLFSAESLGQNAARRALARLNPTKPATGRMPVVFDPRVGRGLLNTFAGCISGSSVARGASFLKDKMHTQLFAPGISIIDDPHLVRGLASKPYDGEGVANRRRALVDKGILSSWLLDMRSASRLGLETTGHAARGLASPPSPSSTNLYMEKGTLTPAALIRDINNGIYITETFGHGVNPVTGDYSQGAAGFRIENGEITTSISEFTIAGHLGEMFLNLTPADDLVFRYGTNAPTLRIDSMTVAGG